MTGLSAVPPTDLVEKAAKAIFDEEGPECIDMEGAAADAAAALAAVWPDIAAVVDRVVRETRTTIADEITEKNPRDGQYAPDWHHALRWAAWIAEGGPQ